MKRIVISDAAGFRANVTLSVTRETRVLEFKSLYERNDAGCRELRKDVAALNNTFGGTIIVGIAESNDAEYTRALRLVDPNMPATMAWVDQTLGARMYPAPHYSLAVISVRDLAPHDILAINVQPVPDGLCAVEVDDASLRFPVRTEDRVRYLRAPEVVKAMTNAAMRRITIALNELAQANQKVHLASPVYFLRLETEVEYHARLRNQFQLTSWPGVNPPVPRAQVEAKLQTTDAFFDRHDERQLALRIDGTIVTIPLTLVRDVWSVGSGLGLMLDCDVLISQDPVVGVVLRGR